MNNKEIHTKLHKCYNVAIVNQAENAMGIIPSRRTNSIPNPCCVIASPLSLADITCKNIILVTCTEKSHKLAIITKFSLELKILVSHATYLVRSYTIMLNRNTLYSYKYL